MNVRPANICVCIKHNFCVLLGSSTHSRKPVVVVIIDLGLGCPSDCVVVLGDSHGLCQEKDALPLPLISRNGIDLLC